MLASLLPGLRDLRVPLTTGYLWVIGLWILLGTHILEFRGNVGSPVKELLQVGQFFGKGALAAALAFLAYSVGSLLQVSPRSALFGGLLRAYVRGTTISPAISEALESFISSDVQNALQAEVEAQRKARDTGTEAEHDPTPVEPVPVGADGRYRMEDGAPGGVAEQKSGESSDSADFGYGDFEPPLFTEDELAGLRSDYEDEYTDYGRIELNRVDADQCILAASRVISRELPSLSTRLVVANDRLFDQYDRLYAEVDMRLNLAAPIGLIFVGLAVTIEPWFLVGFLLPVLLLRQAAVRLRSSDELLIQCVVSGVVESTAGVAVKRWVVGNYRRAPAKDG